MRLPSLTSLRAFESAARLENFTRAGEELSVTHGAISRQIGVLERELGMSLFERQHGMVRLTACGLQLRDELTSSFMRISAATERVRQRSPRQNLLRLNAPPAFSVRWLIPRVSTFQRLNPAVEISLTSSVAPPQFPNDNYDLAIRRFNKEPTSGYAVALFDEISIPVCHVDLLGPSQRRPADIAQLMKLARFVRVEGEPRGWKKWAKTWRADISSARYVDVEMTYLAVQAALEGLGVALLPLALASDDIARGVLTAPLGLQQVDRSRYFVLSGMKPPSRSVSARTIDWLQSEGAEAMSAALATIEC
jgi:LysR family glycine cleavage system transcriptional activator